MCSWYTTIAFATPARPKFFCNHAAAKKDTDGERVELARFKRAMFRLIAAQVDSAHWLPALILIVLEEDVGIDAATFRRFSLRSFIGKDKTSVKFLVLCTTVACGVVFREVLMTLLAVIFTTIGLASAMVSGGGAPFWTSLFGKGFKRVLLRLTMIHNDKPAAVHVLVFVSLDVRLRLIELDDARREVGLLAVRQLCEGERDLQHVEQTFCRVVARTQEMLCCVGRRRHPPTSTWPTTTAWSSYGLHEPNRVASKRGLCS